MKGLLLMVTEGFTEVYAYVGFRLTTVSTREPQFLQA